MFAHAPRLGGSALRPTGRRTVGRASDNMNLNSDRNDTPVAQRHTDKLVNIMTNLSKVSSVKNDLAR